MDNERKQIIFPLAVVTHYKNKPKCDQRNLYILVWFKVQAVKYHSLTSALVFPNCTTVSLTCTILSYTEGFQWISYFSIRY